MFKKIVIFFMCIAAVFATSLEESHKIFQRVLREEFVELAEELMKIERWEDNANVYNIAFQITQTEDPYDYYKLYSKLCITKKTVKVKKIFDKISEVLGYFD